jgi:hypothetical protein
MAAHPIRFGLIGLSGATKDDYEGTYWTPNAHFPFLRTSPHFEIVALLNSSAMSAKAAVRKYGLLAETKAYGDPDGKFIVLYAAKYLSYALRRILEEDIKLTQTIVRSCD